MAEVSTMRVQLIKFLVGNVFVLICRPSLVAQAHALNAEARRDRIAFLAEQLKLKPLSPQVITSIPDLVQPSWEPNPK